MRIEQVRQWIIGAKAFEQENKAALLQLILMEDALENFDRIKARKISETPRSEKAVDPPVG